MIYAVHILNCQFTKIGYSANEDVSRRIAELQTGCPFKIEPLFTIAGTLMQEKSLHSALAIAFTQIRIPMPPNEWYPGRNPFFQQFLKELKFGATAGMAFCDSHDDLQSNRGVRAGTTPRHNLKKNLRWPIKADLKAERSYFPAAN